MTGADQALEHAHRFGWATLLGHLVAHTRRIDLAEDALAEAFEQAVTAWQGQVPTNPDAWLFTTARRRVIDMIRKENTAARVVTQLRLQDQGSDRSIDGDDRIALLWMACHPCLSPEVRPALALRFVLGMPTDAIADIFGVSHATMSARLTRAKRRLAVTGAAWTLEERDLTQRSEDVAQALLLSFTAGYYSSEAGTDRAADAVWLSLLAHRHLPDDPSLRALAALVSLQHARRDARFSGGRLVTLGEQDRRLWRRDEMVRGLRLLSSDHGGSPFAEQLGLMAAIAAAHAVAPSVDDTDWALIDRYYGRLEQLTDSASVRLNRQAARLLAHRSNGIHPPAHVPDVGANRHRGHLLSSHLLRDAGDLPGASDALDRALATCNDGAERAELLRQQAELGRIASAHGGTG